VRHRLLTARRRVITATRHEQRHDTQKFPHPETLSPLAGARK
jgi:hypothetical protein